MTSSCMKHDGCLLSLLYCDMPVISVLDVRGKDYVAAAMANGFFK
jgi:hypothetical protein